MEPNRRNRNRNRTEPEPEPHGTEPNRTEPKTQNSFLNITRAPEKLYMMSCNDLCSKFCADSYGDNEKAGKKFMSKTFQNLPKPSETLKKILLGYQEGDPSWLPRAREKRPRSRFRICNQFFDHNSSRSWAMRTLLSGRRAQQGRSTTW